MNTNPGRFVWYELMTTDTKAAIAFYTEVVGWRTQAFDPSHPDAYTMWVTSQGPMGGVVTLPEQVKQMGAPPHWMAHVEVANVDESVKLVTSLGGKVYVPPQDVPKVGRFSVIADPQGGSISLYTPSDSMGGMDSSKEGQISWNELMTTDHNAAFKFYSQVFGWEKTGEHDMGPMGVYLLFGQGGKAYGGMMTIPPNMQMPTAWNYYIHLDDLDSAITRAKSKGAKLINGPMDVPTGERIAQFFDPQGAAFSLHGPGLNKPAA
jgi:hypothetical protein